MREEGNILTSAVRFTGSLTPQSLLMSDVFFYSFFRVPLFIY